MNRGPLRRVVGAAGLVALAPTAVMLAAGSVTPVDAAVRAVVTLVVLVGVGRMAGWYLHSTAAAFERQQERDDDDDEATPRRRAEDDPGPRRSG